MRVVSERSLLLPSVQKSVKCGTCRFFSPLSVTFGKSVHGKCIYNVMAVAEGDHLPYWVKSDTVGVVFCESGKTCLTWKR